MGMLENMAEMMQAKKEREKDSVERFSEKLEISPSTLQDYLKARGNPTVKMIERLKDGRGPCRPGVGDGGAGTVSNTLVDVGHH